MSTNTRHMELVTAAAIVALLAGAGCSRAKPAFDCDRPGASCGSAAGAVCVDDRCAIPSSECPSGLAYADNAGDLAGTCVTDGAPPPIDGATGQFTVTVAGDERYLRPGASTTVSVTVSRQPGFTEAIDVTIDALPEGLTAEPIVIAAGETSGLLTLQAAASATPGTAASAQVTGRAVGFESASSLPVLIVGTPGTLDESFGTGGFVSDAFRATSLIVQADGRIVVGGQVKLIRFTARGVIDDTFGLAGVVEHDFINLGGPPSTSVLAVAQSDGKIVLVTTIRSGSNGDVAMLRYDANGVPDPMLRLRHAFGSAATEVDAVTVGPQDELIVTGRLQSTESNTDVFVARFLANGQVDEFFDGDGLVTWDLDVNDSSHGVTVQSDGSILVLTKSLNGQMFDPGRPRLIRLKPVGALDLLFASSGVLTFSGTNPTPLGVTVDGSGRIVVAGSVNSGLGAGDQALWAYTSQGQPESGFGIEGLWTAAPTTVVDIMTVPMVAPNASLYVAGAVFSDFTTADPLVVHVDDSGSLDSGFGSGGTAAPGGIGVAIDRAALLADHRLLMVGSTFEEFRLLRLWY